MLLVMLSWEVLIRLVTHRLVHGGGFSVAKRVKRYYCQISFRITIGMILKERTTSSVCAKMIERIFWGFSLRALWVLFLSKSPLMHNFYLHNCRAFWTSCLFNDKHERVCIRCHSILNKNSYHHFILKLKILRISLGSKLLSKRALPRFAFSTLL